MRYISYLFQIVLVLYLADYASNFVLGGKYLYIVLLFGGTVLLMMSSWKQKFIFFSLMIFLPILLSKAFPLPTKTAVELLAPFLCIVSIVESLKMRKTLFNKEGKLFFIAIGVLLLLVLTHYILNPVFGRLTFGSGVQSGGLKSYFLVFAGVTTFLSSYLFFKNNELDSEKYLIILLIICLVMGNLYIVGLFTNVPYISKINLGSSHITREGFQYSSIPLRVMHALGTCLLLSLFHYRKWGVLFILVFLNTLAFMVFGGGRASGPLVLLPILAYVTLINRRVLVPVMAAMLIVSGAIVLFMSNVTISEYKFGRAFLVEGGLKEQSEARFYSFMYMYEIFKRNPIIGKGVGYQRITEEKEFFKKYPDAKRHILYMEAQLMSGGHGSYLSILSIYGLGGFFWLTVMVWGSIYHAYKFIKKNDYISRPDTILAIFAFSRLLSIAVAFVAGGHGGYDNMKLWYLSGIIVGLMSKDAVRRNMDFPNGEKTVHLQSS